MAYEAFSCALSNQGLCNRTVCQTGSVASWFIGERPTKERGGEEEGDAGCQTLKKEGIYPGGRTGRCAVGGGVVKVLESGTTSGS